MVFFYSYNKAFLTIESISPLIKFTEHEVCESHGFYKPTDYPQYEQISRSAQYWITKISL